MAEFVKSASRSGIKSSSTANLKHDYANTFCRLLSRPRSMCVGSFAPNGGGAVIESNTAIKQLCCHCLALYALLACRGVDHLSGVFRRSRANGG